MNYRELADARNKAYREYRRWRVILVSLNILFWVQVPYLLVSTTRPQFVVPRAALLLWLIVAILLAVRPWWRSNRKYKVARESYESLFVDVTR